MSSIIGRAIVLVKTNKSGGSLAKGDVVIVDTSNDNAVTTTTSAATTVQVGVVIEENGIANNASGRVCFGGHVELVNVNASVTRGHYGATHTVAKQATDAGASRAAGSFCIFTTGGTTPEADLFIQPDTAGASGAPSTAKYITAAADGGLSAEIPRPELDDYSASGATDISFSGATAEANTTYTAETDMAGKFAYSTINSRAHIYVANALGSGAFDVRCRITDIQPTTPHTSASTPFVALFVADSSLTASTRQSIQIGLSNVVTSSVPSILAVTNASGFGSTIYYPKLPIILRLARSGTTLTAYYSNSEGRTWVTLGTATTSTDFQRVGLLGQGGSTGTQTTTALVHWFRKF